MRTLLALFFLTIGTTFQAQHYTLDQLRQKLNRATYPDKVLLEFKQSIDLLESQPNVYEYLPGEVIAWSLMDGRLLLYNVFLIENEALTQVNILPNDAAFLKKLNSYAPRESRFIYRRELFSLPAIRQKLPDGSYLINVDVTSYNPRPYEPSEDILTYNLEYSTKDFVNFGLLRLKNTRSDVWIEVERD